jgi:L-alanine-DL-glutamate epimerase-like enolase superfamily enzyme
MTAIDSRTVLDVETFGAQVPYRRGYRWALNEYVGPCVMLVRVRDNAGLEGWGEIPLLFHPMVGGSAIEVFVASLAQRLVVGAPPRPRRFVAEAMALTGWSWYPHMGATVMAGIELALWDLAGKQCERHVTDLLGGRVRDRMECMWFVFDDEPAAMADDVAAGRSRGFRCHYIKWHGAEADMLEKVAAVCDAFGPDDVLRIDPNESWTCASGVRLLKRLERYPIEFVEQPLARFDRRGTAELRRRSAIAIASDQATRRLEEVVAAIADGAMDLLSIAPSDAGGIGPALEIAATARAAALPVFLHSNNELAAGLAAMISVACLADNCSYASQTEYFQLDRDVAHGIQVDGNGLTLDWTRPGLGIEMDAGALASAQANYRDGAANISLLDHEELERHFIPGR